MIIRLKIKGCFHSITYSRKKLGIGFRDTYYSGHLSCFFIGILMKALAQKNRHAGSGWHVFFIHFYRRNMPLSGGTPNTDDKDQEHGIADS